MAILPISKAIAKAARRADSDGLAEILAWLESENRDAEEWAASESRYQGHPESADQYAAGYRDALINVMHHLVGPGE